MDCNPLEIETPKEALSDDDNDNLDEIPTTTAYGDHLLSITTRFAQHTRGKQPMDHNTRVCNEYLRDLQSFVTTRVGSKVILNIPGLEENNKNKNPTKLVEDLTKQGWYTPDWNSSKLNSSQLNSAVQSLAVLHAAGLAYRMSMKTNFECHYPWLMEDVYTSNMTKELIAKHLDSYLHCLSFVSGAEEIVGKLRRIEQDVFQYLVSFRRPRDELGSRFSTVCHGDAWQGNMMFRETEGETECALLQFHCSGYLSPASDLAHLILSSSPRELVTMQHYHHMVEMYYNKFNTTLAQFGLVLKHLGTNYNHFTEEVRRAMAGQFLVVALVVPIVALFGPQELQKIQDTRRRSSVSERINTVRHLIQMMAITEEMDDSSEDDTEIDKEVLEPELEMFLGDKNMSNYIKELFMIGTELKILDSIRPQFRPRSGSWDKTKHTTAKFKPVYLDKSKLLETTVEIVG